MSLRSRPRQRLILNARSFGEPQQRSGWRRARILPTTSGSSIVSSSNRSLNSSTRETFAQSRSKGWKERAFVPKGVSVPATMKASALLSPFDSLVWFRPRNERLFNFHYRIEIYTPEARRKYGYYVLPFMVDGEVVGRVDAKADRAAGTLRIPGAFAEPGAPLAKTASSLARELRMMARWLDLESVEVGRKGNLAASLSTALAGRRR